MITPCYRRSTCLAGLAWLSFVFRSFALLADHPDACDPAKVVTSGTCAKCHAAEVEVWKNTPHFRTFDTLHRSPKAKEIAQKMGISSIKRSAVCTQCHYTQQTLDGNAKIVSGISCESCHGAAKDWLAMHNDYGGPHVTKLQESLAHREERMRNSIANGMRNPHNLYLIARSCLACHTVPHEQLVNVGGHAPGSLDFDLVAWSQGKLKHNFLSHNGVNQASSAERLRVMYLVGLVAELEFSTRATAQATEKGKFGLTVASRAAETAQQIYAIQQQLNHTTLGEIVAAFAEADLRTHNGDSLNAIADRIQRAGVSLADQLDGKQLGFIDSLLPPPTKYK
jgi:Cytochrome c554 and c-prime